MIDAWATMGYRRWDGERPHAVLALVPGAQLRLVNDRVVRYCIKLWGWTGQLLKVMKDEPETARG